MNVMSNTKLGQVLTVSLTPIFHDDVPHSHG